MLTIKAKPNRAPIQTRIRAMCGELRTRPIDLREIIPMMQAGADRIDALEAEVKEFKKRAERQTVTIVHKNRKIAPELAPAVHVGDAPRESKTYSGITGNYFSSRRPHER